MVLNFFFLIHFQVQNKKIQSSIQSFIHPNVNFLHFYKASIYFLSVLAERLRATFTFRVLIGF